MSIELKNIDHSGHLCMHYKGDKTEVLEMCRVDFTHSGKMTMNGSFSKTSNGMVLKFGEPVVSDMNIKICESTYCTRK